MANKDDYLVDYSKFFKNFAETLNPHDPLPVKLASYKLLNIEVIGGVIDWTTQYLNEKNCPKSLLAPLINITIRKTREKCKLDPRACGFNVSDNAYEPLKLMQSVVARCNEICSLYLDNSLLCSLPPPNNHYHRHPISVCAVKNGRRRMEDRHVVIHDLNTILNLHEDVSPSSYYAVFDGHAGHDAAVYSATHLHQYLGESEHFPNNPDKALTEAFFKTDAYFVQKCEVENFSSGTTAVCVLLRPQEKFLYVAWAGDSMALIANKGRILQCVVPHKPGRKDEQDRIAKAGGSVVYWGTWRVNGQLAVSRAIGDAEFKPSVVATPDIQKVALDGGEDFIILACDGLWDFVNDDLAAKEVYTAVCKNPEDVEDVSQGLVKLAKLHGSIDNISVIVVFLRDPCEVAADAQWLPSTIAEGTTTSDQDTATAAAAAAATAAVSQRYPSIAEAVSEAIRAAAAMDAAAGLDNNPFANNDAATTGEHIQKDPFLLDLDSFKQQTAEINSVPNNEFFLLERSTNGNKRSAEDVFDDDDFGPETNVDGDGMDNLEPQREGDNNYIPADDKMADQFRVDDEDVEFVQDMSPVLLAAQVIADGVNNSNNPERLLNRLEEEVDFVMEKEFNKGEFVGDDFAEEDSREKVMEKEDGANPLVADDVHDGHLVDNVVDSGEESEDEWNYFKGNTPKDNIDPSGNSTTVDNLEGDDSDMSQLNPNAAEFVPVSPTRSAASPQCLALINETIYAQSPKPLPTERNDIDVPEPNDFQTEIKSRPSDICNTNNGLDVDLNTNSSLQVNENLLNGRNAQHGEFQPNKSTENFHFGPNATPFVTQVKLLADSSTKANIDDPDKNTHAASNNPFGDQTDFQAIMSKESDPMSMSFYQDKYDKSDADPFDLNKVQLLPDDLDELLSKSDDKLTVGADERRGMILTTDLDDKPQHEDDLLLGGIREIPKSPHDDIKTPEPTFDENLCPNNELIERGNSEINDLCGQIENMAMDDSIQSKLANINQQTLAFNKPEETTNENISDRLEKQQFSADLIECHIITTPSEIDDSNRINEMISPEPINQEVPNADVPVRAVEAPETFQTELIQEAERIETPVDDITSSIKDDVSPVQLQPELIPELHGGGGGVAGMSAPIVGVAGIAAVCKKTTKETPPKKFVTAKATSTPKSAANVSKVGSCTKSASSKPLLATKAAIPRTLVAAKLNSSATNAGKLSAASARPKTAPIPIKAPSDRKQLLNGETKSTLSASTKPTAAAPKPRVAALPFASKATSTKPTAAKLSPEKPTASAARPFTAPAKTTTTTAAKPASAVGTVPKPKPTATSTARTLKIMSNATVSKTATTSSTKTSSAAPSATSKPTATTKATASAVSKHRVSIGRTAPPKAPDTEKQNKENVNKQTASRTATTAVRNNAITNGKPTGSTSSRKIEPKVGGTTARSALTKSTASAMNRLMATKKGANDAAKPITTQRKITKSSAHVAKVNGLSNGLADNNARVVENIDVIPIINETVDVLVVVKDNSPIMENSQLINAAAAD